MQALNAKSFSGELTKFGMVPKKETVHCLKVNGHYIRRLKIAMKIT